MRSLVRWTMLALAVVPTSAVLLLCLNILVTEGTDSPRWHEEIWGYVIAQVVAVLAFIVHASQNAGLSQEEKDKCVFDIVWYVPVGMIGYWMKHLSSDRPSR